MFTQLRNLAPAALMAAGLAAALPPAASAAPGWTINRDTGEPFNLPSRPPPDLFTNNGPFASYMYGSIVLGPAPAVSVNPTVRSFAFFPAPVTQSHVEWCRANFRSYDVDTDTYVGLDGLSHRCFSP